MRVIDILLLILLVWGGYRGLKKGLILELFSVGALVLATLGSIRFVDRAVGLCSGWYHGQSEVLPYVVFVLLFVAILITITFVGKFFKAIIKPTLLGRFDRFVGSVVGSFKWAIYSSTLLWLGSLLELKIPEGYTENTFLFPIIESLVPQLLAWCPSWVSFIQEWLKTNDSIHQ